MVTGADGRGVHVSGVVGTLLVSFGEHVRVRPFLRMGENPVRVGDAPLQLVGPAVVVVVRQHPRRRVEQEARRRALHVRDVRSDARPGGAAVGGRDLELVSRAFGTGHHEDVPVPEVRGGLFGGPVRFREIGFDRPLRPGQAVIRTRHHAPRLVRGVGVVAGEPQAHHPRAGHVEHVGDLYRHGRQGRRRDLLERGSVGRAVQVVVGPLAGAAHPQQHRARLVQPLADRHFADGRVVGDARLGPPRRAAVRRNARVDAAHAFLYGMLRSPAVGAHQVAAQSLDHRPRVVARHVLHHGDGRAARWIHLRRRTLHDHERCGNHQHQSFHSLVPFSGRHYSIPPPRSKARLRNDREGRACGG